MIKEKQLGETAYDFRMNKDAVLLDTKVSKGDIISIQNQRFTKFWDVYLANGRHIEVKEHYLWKNFLVPEDITFCDEVNEFEMFKLELDMQKFFNKPNIDLSSAFTKLLSKKEYNDYVWDQKTQSSNTSTDDFNLSLVPIEEQAMWVNWPTDSYFDPNWGKDLGEFKNCHAVIISERMLETLGMLLAEHTFYLEVVELEDRYRFFLKYNSILGSKWMFENYKGEKWNRKV